MPNLEPAYEILAIGIVASTIIGSCHYENVNFFRNETERMIIRAEYGPVPGPVESRNVVGDTLPDTFLDLDGVRYFSSVDGKNISDVVRGQ